MSEDPEAKKNPNEPPVLPPEIGGEPVPSGDESVSTLRESLATDEQGQVKPAKKSGFLQRVTGALHLPPKKKTGQIATNKPGPVSPEEQSNLSQPLPGQTSNQIDTPAGAATEITDESISKSTEAPLETDIPPEETSFPPERKATTSSLASRLWGLGELAPEQSTSPRPEQPDANPPAVPGPTPTNALEPAQLTGDKEGETTPEPPAFPLESEPKPGVTRILPKDWPGTTSSLASRLWGLQELASDQEEHPSQEPESTPYADEPPPAPSAESPDEGSERRSFFDRLKGPQGDEKVTRQLDDNQVMHRIAGTTGELHEPPASLMPGRTMKGSHGTDKLQADAPKEENHEETSRFTFFNVDDKDAPPLPGFPSPEPSTEPKDSLAGSSASPFVQEQPADGSIPASGKVEDGRPFFISDDILDSIGSQDIADTSVNLNDPDPFNLEQIVAVSNRKTPPEEKETMPAKEELTPEEEHPWSYASLDDLRPIALDVDEIDEGSPSGGKAQFGDEPLQDRERRPRKRESWWSSLSPFERVFLGVTGLLIVTIAVIMVIVLISSILRPYTPPVVPKATSTPSGFPSPNSIILPGGWNFTLHGSSLQNASIGSGNGTWLVGSEVRRVVELPWNKQLEAVVHTFTTGDPIQLVFDDHSTLNYQVQQIERVKVTDTSILVDASPSLAVILSGETSDQRWVIIATP